MKKKRLKLKKKVWVILAIVIFIPIFIFSFIKIRNNYLYHQSIEYKLLVKDYSNEEIDLIKKYLNNYEINKLIDSEEKDTALIELISEPFYKNELKERYEEYINNNKVSPKEAINIVNINRDLDYYSTGYKTDTSKNELMLVNKYYLLDEKYVPNDLVKISSKYSWGEENYCTKTVLDAFLQMHKKAQEEDIYLMINSSYRPYSDQLEVYEKYKKLRNEKYADSIAARPGASEHQTGLALDIFELKNSSSKTFHETKAYTWLKDNSYLFGFILRYPENKENITGYDFEAWHYRYVGTNDAKKIHDLDITFDEYYANYLS